MPSLALSGTQSERSPLEPFAHWKHETRSKISAKKKDEENKKNKKKRLHSLLFQVADDSQQIVLLIRQLDPERRLPRKLVLQVPNLQEQSLALFAVLKSQSSYITFLPLRTISITERATGKQAK
jgi:hypothetical protein